MTDIIDEASNNVLLELETLSFEARQKANRIPEGSPGECVDCGCYSKRLVCGVCSPCRDS